MELFGIRRYVRKKVRRIFDGRRHNPRVLEKGLDTIHSLKVTLEELYNGTSKLISISRQVKCSTCLGNGTTSSSWSECSRCEGSGEMLNSVYPEEGVVIAEQQFCNMCKGTGRDISNEDPCPECKGRTMVVELRRLEVVVDKGMPNGYKIRFPGEAESSLFWPIVHPISASWYDPGHWIGCNGPYRPRRGWIGYLLKFVKCRPLLPFDKEAGDAVFVLEQMEHPKFKRNGDDLFVTLPRNEALSDSPFTLTHLDNRKILIKRPEELAQHGADEQVIMNEGMPIHEKPFAKGNLFVCYTVE